MTILLLLLIGLIALEHYYFLVLEMFFWTKPLGLKAFGLKKEDAEKSKVLAANQGLYNGLLASGLVYSLYLFTYGNATYLLYFLFTSIVVAGVYGAYSTKKASLFFIQAVPALVALIVLVFV